MSLNVASDNCQACDGTLAECEECHGTGYITEEIPLLTPSPEQQRVIDQIGEWLRGPEQVFTLGGYAGTGKTTIIRHIIEGLSNVVCATPTGKAAAVLESKLGKTGVEVGTLHSLLYKPIEVTEEMVTDQKQELDALRRAGMDTTAALKRLKRLIRTLEAGSCEFGMKDEPKHQPVVVVDEASMVGDMVEADLRAQASKILFVGDPGQLPPVEGTEFFSRNKPDAVLETIHRQAADSTILRLAHAVRHDEVFTDWNDTDCVLTKGMDFEFLAQADQIITGKNVTRRTLNTGLRKLQGFVSKFPQLGEKLICLRNERERGLINGVAAVAASPMTADTFGDLAMDIAYEDRLFKGLEIDAFAFAQYADPKLTRRSPGWSASPASQFDFGYAITCHKSQGSEWPTVAIYDDKMRRHDKAARRRWIYTAVTRAAERLIWVNPK